MQKHILKIILLGLPLVFAFSSSFVLASPERPWKSIACSGNHSDKNNIKRAYSKIFYDKSKDTINGTESRHKSFRLYINTHHQKLKIIKSTCILDNFKSKEDALNVRTKSFEKAKSRYLDLVMTNYPEQP